MKNLRFEDLPMAVETVLERISSVEETLGKIMTHFQPKEPVELMTRQEVALYFKVNIATIHNWTKKGKLQSYGIGARVYYKRAEINQSLIKMI